MVNDENLWEYSGHIFMFFFVFTIVLVVFANVFYALIGVPFSDRLPFINVIGLESAICAIIGFTSYGISWRQQKKSINN